MKKISLLLLCCVASWLSFAQTDYYVASSGDDANVGTSEAPFATIAKAVEAVNTEFASKSAHCVVNIGEGTFAAKNLDLVSQTDGDTVIFRGAGANKTILTAAPGVDAVPQAALFTEMNTEENNINICIRNLKVYNYGFTDTKDKTAIYRLIASNTAGVTVGIDSCVVEKIQTGDAPLIKTTPHKQNHVIISNSYFTDVKTVYWNNQMTTPIDFGAGTISITNSIFDGFEKSGSSDSDVSSQVKNSWGVVLTLNSYQNKSTAAMDAHIVNNTFINSTLSAMSNQQVNQSVICLRNKYTDIIFDLELSNNIVLCDTTRFMGKDGTGADEDKSFCAFRELHDSEFTNLHVSNNILQRVDTFVISPYSTNVIDSTLIHSASEIGINIDANGDLVYDITATGIPYIKAEGSLVYGQADATVQTTYDIAGTPRATPGCIGAYEKPLGQGTSVESTLGASVSLYPNPVNDILYVKGDVSQIVLYTLDGRAVQTLTVQNNQVDLGQLPEGLYLARCSDTSGLSISIQRILKK